MEKNEKKNINFTEISLFPFVTGIGIELYFSQSSQEFLCKDIIKSFRFKQG